MMVRKNELKQSVDSGDFNGADFNYKWDGTKLGVKNSKETEYEYTDLKGEKGERGDCNFATFTIEYASGLLIMNKMEGLLLDFKLNNNGEIEVLI